MFQIRPGVGKKLLGLAVLNVAVLALIAAIAAIAFNRVEILAADIARTQMTGVLENASIGRELSAAFSEIDLISRSCRSSSASEDLGKGMSAALAGIAQKNQDTQQAEAIAALSLTTSQLLDQCVAIRRALLRIASVDHQILAELAKLEDLIGRTLIEQTLSGKGTDHLDQIMTLITGFRETMLQVGKNIAESGVETSAGPTKGDPSAALIDDLNLRLQTLTASSPEVARIARRAIRLTRAYRGEVLQLDNASNRFNDALVRSHAAKTTALKIMGRLDEQASGRAAELALEIRQAVAAASRWVLGLSLLIALLSFLAIAAIIRGSINRPLHEVLQHIDAIRHGAVKPDIGQPGADEWGTIHSALLDMTSKLARSRSLLQTVVDTVPMRVFWKDKDLRYLACNPAFASDAGKSCPQDLIGKDDYQMGWADQAESYRADDVAVMASGISRLSFDEPQTRPDGRTRWLRTSKVPLKDSDNQTIGVLGVYEDITERKQAEIALREREEIFSAIVNRSVEGILLIDAETMEFAEFNVAASAGLGYTREEFSRLRMPDIQGAMSAEETRAKCLEAANSPDGMSFEIRHRCKDGSLRDRHVSNRPVEVHGRIYLASVWHDVTESKQLADALRQREQYQRALLDNFPFMVWLKDEQSRFLAVNQAFAQVFGWPSAESLLGKTDLDIAPQELAEAYRADDRAVLESGTSKQVEELIQTDGRRRWFETYKSPVAIDNRIIGTVGFGRDITERRRNERRLELAVKVTKVILWELDFANGQLSYDRAQLPLLGLTPDDELGSLTQWIEHVHPDDRQPLQDAVERAMQVGHGDFDLEYRICGTVDRYQWVHSKGSVIQRDPAGKAELAVGTSRNITERKSIEQALRQSEERSRKLATLLRLMADNVPDMIWAKDLENRYLFANRALCQQFLNAADTDEPLGKTDLFFVQRERASHPHDPQWQTFGEGCLDSDAITLQRDRPQVFEEFGNIEGRRAFFEVHKAPFLDENGAVIGTVGSARDITERKQTEAELQRHREDLEHLVEQRTSELLATEARATRILDCTADGLYGVDGEGRITFINPAACQMLGYTAEQVMGRSAHQLFHHSRPNGSPYPPAECPARQARQAGRDCRVADETYWHAEGHAVPVTLATRPIVADGKVFGAVVSVVDVSLQRAAAQAREQALIAAENLARARSEFLANMSHEIRTPMNGVLGFAQIGQRNHQDPDKARNAFEKIITSGQQLLGVVNDILDFSKIDAGKLQVETREMVLGETLDHALELVAARARAKGLELRRVNSPELPTSCIGDPLRLGQVLLNLLNNAVKFTETGSVILSAARQGEQLIFRVTDTGIGMTADQLGYVFNPFQQADGSTTRRFGGTGLGLAICKRLVELMQGEIRVESAPGNGSLFEVRLPYVPSAAHPDTVEATSVILAKKPLAGISILLAEDDEINQLIQEVNLLDDGAHLVIVGDGAKAVQRVISDGPQAYDIVLMDIQMPVMDGYEAARRIRELAPELPIIGQTAHAFDEDRDKCLAVGMAGHIGKPIDPQALATLILSVLGTRRGS